MSLEDLNDLELAELGRALHDELHRRALERHDPPAVAEQAHNDSFLKGLPVDPYVVGGFIVCCGGLKAKLGGQRHRCSFVVVDGEAWCWQVDYVIDDVRHDGDSMTSVTLLVGEPGMVVTQVSSNSDMGRHSRQLAESWQYDGAVLTPTQTPSRVPDEHRR